MMIRIKAGPILGLIPSFQSKSAKADYLMVLKIILPDFPCGVRCVKSDFNICDLLGRRSGSPQFEIINIKHVQYLRSEILLCVGNTADSQEFTLWTVTWKGTIVNQRRKQAD